MDTVQGCIGMSEYPIVIFHYTLFIEEARVSESLEWLLISSCVLDTSREGIHEL